MANTIYTATLTDTDGVVVQTVIINSVSDADAKNQLTVLIPLATAEDSGNIGTWTLTRPGTAVSVPYP